LGIDHLLTRRPHELSGGERQRVALGRAIVRNPAAFLFDEPLSNLDAQLRTGMRSEIRRLQQELHATMVYVTHDQVEAMTLGDRIAVMNRGRIEQIGTPRQIYLQPANRFVAEFIGSSPMNFIEGVVVREATGCRFASRCGKWTWDVPTVMFPEREPVTLGIRPEHVTIRPWTDGAMGAPGRVVRTDWLGDAVVTQVALVAQAKRGCDPGDSAETAGWDRGGNERCGSLTVLARSTAQEVRSRDELVAVDFDAQRIVWFDPDRGANLMKDNQA
jgi:multiple sugar transport system ATP-binding protein